MNAAAGASEVGQPVTLELRTAATAALIPTIRTVASDLAARADFDLDAISDLRMAVDEVCAALVEIAAKDSRLTCTFDVLTDRIAVEVTVPMPSDGQASVATDTFGWRVLQTLADEVAVVRLPGHDGAPDQLGIRLDKRAITDSQ